MSLDGPALFACDDVGTLGAVDDFSIDSGGALEASLVEALQNVQDIKFVDAGDGDDKVVFQRGNGTFLAGAGNDLISSAGKGDGIRLFNGGAGRGFIAAPNAPRSRRMRGRAVITTPRGLPTGGKRAVLRYASGVGGLVVDLSGNFQISGGGHGVDWVEGTEGGDGADLIDAGGGNDRVIGGSAHDSLTGGNGACRIAGWSGG